MRSLGTEPMLTRAAFLKLAGGMAASAFVASRAAAAPAPILTRPIPKSANNESLPAVGLGTAIVFASHGNESAMAAKADTLRALVESGGKVLDSAASYGDAEEICGDLLAQTKLRPNMFLATKFGERGRGDGIKSIERSFRRLRTEMIDLMYVHNMIDVDTHLPTLRDYKAKKRIRYMGVTSTGGNQDDLTKWMSDLDFVEFAYAVDTRDAEKRLLPTAKDKGVAVFVALPFGRNRLLNAVSKTPFPEWAKQELNCETFAQLLLKFVISHPAVTTAIPGTANPKHMAENLDAARGPLPDAKQREKIAAIWTS